MAASSWGDVYRELCPKPIINAIGSVTMLGGSTPPSEVSEAMERAPSAWVPLMELEEKAGQAIAKGGGGKGGGKRGSGSPNPNWPSRTGNPSGTGRGNSPPAKK